MSDLHSSRNPRFRLRPHAVSALAATFAASLVSGCGSPVGNGVGPVSLALSAASGTEVTVQGAARVYQCLNGGISAVLYFSDGTSGNFTSRVKWTSSNPSAVRVSNGEIPAPDGSGNYAPGTLIPISPGAATVTATYGDVSSQMTVSVGSPTDFAINEVVRSIPSPVTDVSLGVGTTRQFTVSAVTDGVPKDISQFARWSLNSSVGSVTASGLVTALGTSDAVPLTASFLNCTNQVSANLSVANITGITIVPQFGNDPVLLNNSERIDVVASLDNGVQQNVSTQAAVITTDSTIATIPVGLDGGQVLIPAAVGSVTVQAQLLNLYSAPDRIVNIAQSTLTGFTVTPATAVIRAGSNEVAHFTALGSYENGQTQDITRAVTWALVDPTLGAISNIKATAGFATPNATLVGQTMVTATPPATDSTASVITATLTVDSVANPATP